MEQLASKDSINYHYFYSTTNSGGLWLVVDLVLNKCIVLMLNCVLHLMLITTGGVVSLMLNIDPIQTLLPFW